MKTGVPKLTSNYLRTLKSIRVEEMNSRYTDLRYNPPNPMAGSESASKACLESTLNKDLCVNLGSILFFLLLLGFCKENISGVCPAGVSGGILQENLLGIPPGEPPWDSLRDT